MHRSDGADGLFGSNDDRGGAGFATDVCGNDPLDSHLTGQDSVGFALADVSDVTWSSSMSV